MHGSQSVKISKVLDINKDQQTRIHKESYELRFWAGISQSVSPLAVRFQFTEALQEMHFLS